MMVEKESHQWRKKCYLLAQVNPDAFLVKTLSKKELKGLIKNNSLFINPQKLSAQKYYFFYCEKYIYGVFKPSGFKNNCVIFHNLTQYKNPLRLWGLHHDKNKLQAAFRQKKQLINMLEKENFRPKTLMMVVKKSENDLLSIYVSSEKIDHLIQHFPIVDPEKIKIARNLFEKINTILDQENNDQEEKVFDNLISLGAKLNDVIFYHPHLSKIINEFNTIKLVNQSFLPIHTWHYPQQKENVKENIFPFVRSKTTHWSYQRKDSHQENHRQNNMINSFAVVDLIDDSLSKLELNTIQKRQMLCIKKEMQVSYLSGKMHDVKTLLASNDFVHLIANGQKIDGDLFFCDEKEPVFSSQEFRFSLKMPKVLFLSMCFSENEKIIKHFFDHGGQSLIVSAGLLSTRELHLYISIFYWQLFSARHSITTAFHSMIYKFFNKKKINAFRLRLYGEGKEIFVGKKDFGEDPIQMTLENE